MHAERRTSERGQAALETVAGVPALVLAALIALQLLAAGWAASLADGAAEAAAMALAGGGEPGAAARAAVPGWARERVELEGHGGEIEVRLRAPALLPGVGDMVQVSSSAWVRPAEARR